MASACSVIHERKWIFVSADVSGGGTRDEAPRTTAWEAIQPVALVGRHINVILAVEPGFSNMN